MTDTFQFHQATKQFDESWEKIINSIQDKLFEYRKRFILKDEIKKSIESSFKDCIEHDHEDEPLHLLDIIKHSFWGKPISDEKLNRVIKRRECE